MGCACTKKQDDASVPKPVINSYPRDPQYANAPPTGAPGPVVFVPGGRSTGMNSGEMFVAGAMMGGGIGGLPGPEMYNPMSGDFQAL